ncbi:tRNA(Ile)-lysidine synthetase [Marinobacterium lacunae]|uniref:tRNA(Ile)-lysidine synthase n=1 Tax=Marinobacterium lacunae TaxID=1232683 RepID=A0A081G0Q6_9GAMM|nr:tRNA lysidine(34) synthetase TilS [Marinobacterium lacunae]KEA64361.1 tRNA(Ile)-lysidine synthetase [Marinobacterium lacunae]
MAELPVLLVERLKDLTHIRRWVIAFSGGVDSRVLLELCAQQLPPERLLALHIDHQLQSGSKEWAKRCEAICEHLNIAYRCICVNPGTGSESDLRDARYQAFEEVLEPGDCLLLAQHADDQAETLFLRLMRGAGVRGLASMPWMRPLGQGVLARPLLDQSRAVIERWAKERGLEWIEDPSNASEIYERNWVRHNLMPLLRGRWPRLHQRVTATTRQLSEACELLDEMAQGDLSQIRSSPEQLPLLPLTELSRARQRNLLRFWVHRVSGHWLSEDELFRVEEQVIGAGCDRTPELKLGGYWLRRYRECLYLQPALPEREAPFLFTLEPGERRLSQGVLGFEQRASQGLPVGARLRLGYRQGGERVRPLGRGGSVSLKQLMQEAGVPPWLRAGWPLLWQNEVLVAVPGICLCHEGVVEGGLTPLWRPFGLSDGGCFGRL